MCALFTCIPILGVSVFLEKKKVLRDDGFGFAIKLPQTNQYHTTLFLLGEGTPFFDVMQHKRSERSLSYEPE